MGTPLNPIYVTVTLLDFDFVENEYRRKGYTEKWGILKELANEIKHT